MRPSIVVTRRIKIPMREIKGRQANHYDGSISPPIKAPVIPRRIQPPTRIIVPFWITKPIGEMIEIVVMHYPSRCSVVVIEVILRRIIVIIVVITVFFSKRFCRSR